MTASQARTRVSGGNLRRAPPRNLFEDAPVSLFTVDRRPKRVMEALYPELMAHGDAA